MGPRALFGRVAVAEAVTWALLLIGMVLKHGTGTTELGVRVFGMLHGIVFVAYCLVALLVWVDQRRSARWGLLALASAVPPFATVVFGGLAGRRLDSAWRLRVEPGRDPAERLASALVRRPVRGAVAGLVATAALTGVALAIGPPVG